MKKTLSILILTVAVAIGCSSAKSTSKLSKAKDLSFEYSATTRGSSVNYVVTRDSIIQKENSRGEITTYKKPVDENDWNDLLTATEKVDLEKLSTIEPPSKKHQFDGAMGATLKITVNGKTYQTQTFDHGNPPEAIKAIIDNITVI
ncbi:hypothetical protein [Flavobacterium album]|nr:hypothetical protein [Flavobacterium album]